jgi:crossover junction endodeoxyribonuclease RuvC
MIVLGVDPGSLVTGYGVIEITDGKMKMLACDAIRNPSSTPMPLRLKKIFAGLNEVVARYRPDQFAIETAFYGKNAQSALKLGHARGAALLAAVTLDIPASEYSPREVKKAVVGKGNASKQQVQYMIKSMLQLTTVPRLYDVTDALAVAVCHLHRAAPHRTTFKGWGAFLAAHPERVASAGLRKSGRRK